METILSTTSRKFRLACAVCLGSTAFATAIILPATDLSATQSGVTAIMLPQADSLRVPADITEEELERVDAAAAPAIAPLLRTLFNTSESAEARLSAAAELDAKIAEMDTSSDGGSAMQRRLTRRVALVRAFVEAGQVDNPLGDSSESIAALNAAAGDAIRWLNTVKNGELWVSYLKLNELKSADVSMETLTAVSDKFAPADAFSEEQNSFLTRPHLASVGAAVRSAIAAASDYDSEGVQAEVQSALNGLLAAILDHEAERVAATAEAARSRYRQLKESYPGAASVVRPVILDNYFNHNIHFTMSEVLLSRLVSDYRTDTGCIADCIMGAWVTGSQVTNVKVTADVKRSADRAQFNLVVNGNTQSNTTGRKQPATVYTRGNHFFTINKPVYIDGEHVTSSRGTISVDTNNTTLGVRTDYDGVPLLGHIVRNIAIQRVNESKGQSEAIAARKLADQALPEFEKEAAVQLEDMDTELHDKLLTGLEEKGIAPDSISARSSNTHIAVSSRTIGEKWLGGSLQPVVPLSSTGLTIQLHESAANNSFDALGLNGRTLLEDDIPAEIEKSLSEILQRDISLSDDEETTEATEETDEEPEPPTTFTFSETDPIRVMFNDGEVNLVIRASVLQEGKEEIPEQIIEIPMTMTLEGDMLIVEPGRMRVSSVDEVNRTKQVLRANQVRRILSRKFTRRELDPTLEMTNASDQPINLTLDRINVGDGWLTAELH